MKKTTTIPIDADPLDRELDLSAEPVRGKYARDFGRMKNLRILAPDLLDAFPDSQSVNDALRQLLAQKPAKISARRVTSPKPRTRKVRP
ncbi:MAG: hypothetical protein JOZ54_14875 [Acidobacteria bacterium]|nr:hypothetical protein [Acidobacteriota bacterium]